MPTGHAMAHLSHGSSSVRLMSGAELLVYDNETRLPIRMGNVVLYRAVAGKSGCGRFARGEVAQVSVRQGDPASPQARGRELARAGRALWQEHQSVKRAAAELMSRHRDVPCLQAYRYACGLSQDQAAARYNTETGHQTSIGGTSINAWETWARGRGAGSPPPFSSLMLLALAYGRGPLGVAEEDIAPGDLVGEAYERMPVEDQMSMRQFTVRSMMQRAEAPARPAATSMPVRTTRAAAHGNVIGPEFSLTVPTARFGNPQIRLFSLPNPRPGELLDLTWDTFGLGIERLISQIKNLGWRLEADACFGINEAGLVMATFLASAVFGRCPVGYFKCQKTRDEISLDDASFYPAIRPAPSVVICDFEVKHADVVGFITRQVRERYPDADIYFAVFGAMTKGSTLEVDFEDLTGARIMTAAGFKAVFIAATMSPPGIEPPLELR
jgi:transcriptional regulator with XRE-family HTH domain